MRIFPTYGHQWLTLCSDYFNPRKEPRYPYVEGCVGPRVGLDVLEEKKSCVPTKIYTQDHPVSRTVTVLAMLPCPHTDTEAKNR